MLDNLNPLLLSNRLSSDHLITRLNMSVLNKGSYFFDFLSLLNRLFYTNKQKLFFL